MVIINEKPASNPKEKLSEIPAGFSLPLKADVTSPADGLSN
jgi:hypothetical protein